MGNNFRYKTFMQPSGFSYHEVRIFMTIHDELILELIKPNRHGEVGKGALIIKIAGTRKVNYRLEHRTSEFKAEDLETIDDVEYAITHLIAPDIVVFKEDNEIAIELENDVHWDFGKSLRQIKKYKNRYDDVRVIIPNDYKRFAPLYKHEGFRVYLWNAMRKWQCLRCGTVTVKKGPVQPKCKNEKCGNTSRNEFRLVGLEETEIEEY